MGIGGIIHVQKLKMAASILMKRLVKNGKITMFAMCVSMGWLYLAVVIDL